MTIVPQFRLNQDDNNILITIRVPYVRISSAEIYADECDFSFYCAPYLLKLRLPYPVCSDPAIQRAQYDMSTDNGTLSVTLPKSQPGQFFPSLDLLQNLVGSQGRTNKSHRNAIKLLGQEREPGYGYGFNNRYSDMLHTESDLVYEMFEMHNIFEYHAIERKFLMYCRETALFDIDRWLFDEIEGSSDPHYSTLIRSNPFWYTYYDMYVQKKPKPAYVTPQTPVTGKDNSSPYSSSEIHDRNLSVDQWYSELFENVLTIRDRDVLRAVRGLKSGVWSVEEIQKDPLDGDTNKAIVAVSAPSRRYCLEFMTELFFAYAYILRFQGDGQEHPQGAEDVDVEEEGAANSTIEFKEGKGAEQGTEVTYESVFSFVSLCPSLRYLIPPGSYSQQSGSLLPLLQILARRFYLSSYLRNTTILRKIFADVVKLFFCGKRICLKVLGQISQILQKSTFFYLFDKLYMQDLIAFVLQGINDGTWSEDNEKFGGLTESDFYAYARELNDAKNEFEAKNCLVGKIGVGWLMHEVEGAVRKYVNDRNEEEEAIDSAEIQAVVKEVLQQIRRSAGEKGNHLGVLGDNHKNSDGNKGGNDDSSEERSDKSSDRSDDGHSCTSDDSSETDEDNSESDNAIATSHDSIAENFDIAFLKQLYGHHVSFLVRMRADYTAFMLTKHQQRLLSGSAQEEEEEEEEWNAELELGKLLSSQNEGIAETGTRCIQVLGEGNGDIADNEAVPVTVPVAESTSAVRSKGAEEWKINAISTKRREKEDRANPAGEESIVKEMSRCSLEADT